MVDLCGYSKRQPARPLRTAHCALSAAEVDFENSDDSKHHGIYRRKLGVRDLFDGARLCSPGL